MVRFFKAAKATTLIAGLMIWGAGSAQEAMDCVVCYACGQNLGGFHSYFLDEQNPRGATPGEAMAKHVARAQVVYVNTLYCSYDVALDGSKYPLYLYGRLVGYVYGAVEMSSYRRISLAGIRSCDPVKQYPYDFERAESSPWAYNAAICRAKPGPSIVLSGPTETKPRGTSGWRELMLTATVTQDNAPVSGKAVTFKLLPKAAPDGHEHGDLASKPAGSVANGATNGAGEYKAPYLPSEFAGVYTVEASCDGCDRTAKLDVTVRVPDLVEMTASTRKPPAYTLIGQTATHPRSHYFSATGLKALMSLVDTMRSLDWSNPGINDASLVWGGRFDIAGRWGGSHAGHREGDEVDISFYRPAGVSLEVRAKTYRKLAAGKQFESPQALWHQNDNPDTGSSAHFHIYLLGQKSSFITKY